MAFQISPTNLAIRPHGDEAHNNTRLVGGVGRLGDHFSMTVANIVTNPSLQPILETSTQTLQQCLALAEFVESQPLSSSSSAGDGDSKGPSEESLLALSKRQKVLFALLAQLRGLNRNAILGVRSTKQETAEARMEIDRLHLQLQNLYYEQRHLAGEIQACESYEYVSHGTLSTHFVLIYPAIATLIISFHCSPPKPSSPYTRNTTPLILTT